MSSESPRMWTDIQCKNKDCMLYVCVYCFETNKNMFCNYCFEKMNYCFELVEQMTTITRVNKTIGDLVAECSTVSDCEIVNKLILKDCIIYNEDLPIILKLVKQFPNCNIIDLSNITISSLLVEFVIGCMAIRFVEIRLSHLNCKNEQFEW